MKNYIVGILSLFDYELKLLKVRAENEYEALKKGIVESCNDDECKQYEMDWQKSPDYPKDYESLVEILYNSDYYINVIENKFVRFKKISYICKN